MVKAVGASVKETAAARRVAPAAGVFSTTDSLVSAATGSLLWYSRTVLTALGVPVRRSEEPPS